MFQIPRLTNVFTAFFLLTGLFLLGPVPFASKAYGQLEEVVVTARRRTEGLQDTPISVSAVSGDRLEAAGISNIADLKNIIPNLQIAVTSSKNPSIFVRGIGQRATTPELDPGVGQYLNGIFIARQDSQLLDAVDIESIQVLRGPQGTLFGKNNTGGAMLVTTREPNSEMTEGYVTLKTGNYGRRDIKTGINIPIIENKLALRVSASAKKLDGYFKNIVDGSYFGDEDRQSLAGRLLWDINEDMSLDFFAYWSKQAEKGSGSNCRLLDPTVPAAAFYIPRQTDTYGDRCAAQENLSKHNKVAINTYDSLYEQQSQLYAMSFSWGIGDLSIDSITAYSRQFDLNKKEDIDATDLVLIHNMEQHALDVLGSSGISTSDESRAQFSQEIKLNGLFFGDRLNLTAGLFYSSEKINDFPNDQILGENGLLGIPAEYLADGGVPGLTIGDIPDPNNALSGPEPVLPLVLASANISNLQNETRAIFVQGSYDVSENWQATLGLRYTEDDKERGIIVYELDAPAYGLQHNLVQIEGGLFAPVPRATFDQIEYSEPLPFLPPAFNDIEVQFSQLSPALTITWQGNDAFLEFTQFDSFLTYLTYSEGYKSGGLSRRGNRINSFEPEIVKNTEIGFKIDALDSRLRLNGAIYYTDYDQIQVQQAEQGPGGQTDVIVFLDNAGAAKVKGAELETTLALGELQIRANVGYTDAFYTEYDVVLQDIGPFDRSAEPFALIPELNTSVVIEYSWQSPLGLVVPRFSYYYRSEIFAGYDATANLFEGSTIGQEETFNARVSWTPSDQWRMAAFVNNIKDSIDFGGGVALGTGLGTTTRARTPPRTYGAELTWSW